MEDSFERQTQRNTLVSEANALAKDLTAYTELCLRVLPNNTQWKSGLKDKLSAVEKIVMPVVTALQQCINDDMSQTSVQNLNPSSNDQSKGKMHVLEIWLDQIVSELQQNKEEGGYLYKTTTELKRYETAFVNKLSEYQGYWYRQQPLGTKNPFLIHI